MLEIPIMSGSPDVNNHFSKISTCNRIFEEIGMPLAPSTAFLYKKEEIVPCLCKLMMENFHIERWIFKIDNEHSGRGIAYYDVNTVPELVELKKEVSTMFEDSVFLELQTILTKTLSKKLKFAYSQLYKSYDDY
jgi:hypothetical protein